MVKVVIYFVLSLAINYMVIGEPFWQLATSNLLVVVIAAIVVFAVGLQCCEDDVRSVKTLGCALMAFSIVGFMSVFFVPSLRNGVFGYLGIHNPDALFDFYEDLSTMQILVIAICDLILAIFLLPGQKEEVADQKEEEIRDRDENELKNE